MKLIQSHHFDKVGKKFKKFQPYILLKSKFMNYFINSVSVALSFLFCCIIQQLL